jgi:acetyl-CoA carboxylase biotin carboxyl carrier protein
MELKEIKELIKLVSEAEVSEVEVEKGDFKIAIKKIEEKTTYVQSAPIVQQAPQAIQVSVPAAPVSATPAAVEVPVASNLITIKSPMIGTFYKSSTPDKPAFVNIGDEIKVGSVLCIVEAMKLFNEIESEVSGKIVKILVENASPVEYDQPLFLVEPK